MASLEDESAVRGQPDRQRPEAGHSDRALELFNFDGVVERGRLVRLGSETFDVTATLTAEDQTLARRKARLDLRFELPLPTDGIPLIRTASGTSRLS